jgi:hypothetical protein
MKICNYCAPVIRERSRAGFLFVLAFFFPVIGYMALGQVHSAEYPVMTRAGIMHMPDDSLKIGKLFDLAFYYLDYLDDDRMADSLSQAAVGIAEMSHKPGWIRWACSRYIGSTNIYNHFEKALDYALKAGQWSSPNDPEGSFTASRDLISVYIAGYDYNKALECSYKSLSVATASDNTSWKIQSYLDIGRSLEGKNLKIEAFRNYLNAAALAEQLNDRKLMEQCYAALAHFYNLNKLYNQAVRYKLLQRDLLEKSLPSDSVALMWNLYDLQEIDLNSGNNRLDELSLQRILDFAGRWKHRRLMKYEMALIRSHLVEANKIALLHDLYYKQFPHELSQLASHNPGLYFRLKAYFCEEEKKTDSATWFFNKAEEVLTGDRNKVLLANFYSRFGQFLVRHGKDSEAIDKFSRSFELASEASYFDFMVNSSRQLGDLYSRKGDFKNAYHFAVLNKLLSDSIENMSKKDQLLVLEIDHETRLREHAAEAEKQSKTRRHYLQYSAILIVIISVFIILLMLGSLKVPEWIIRMLGFFSFILLFEFITLLADQQIHEITHGEPWKILLIKIFLIGILLPIHHWIEKRVVSFLLDPALINISRYPVKSRLKQHISKLNRNKQKTVNSEQ